MNRRERRISARSDRIASVGASDARTLLPLIDRHYHDGRLREADALCVRLLDAEPGHAKALYIRGLVAQRQQRAEDAIAHFNQALVAAPAVAAIHDGLAQVYRILAQPVDAERHYRRVAELQPGAATLLNFGNALMELQRPAEAAAAYRSALTFDGGLAETHHGLGTALAAQGSEQAADAFARAVALRPDFALAHEGLIESCIKADAWEAALRASCQALLHVDTPALRLHLVDCLINATPATDLPGLRQALQRALDERWTRPQDLSRAVCNFANLLQPLEAADRLLRTMLELAPVCHREVEAALTGQRRKWLDAGASSTPLTPEALAAACSLARQCFINEYAWHCVPAEAGRVEALRRAILDDLDRDVVPADTGLVVTAMYLSLGSLDGAGRLLLQPRSPAVAALLSQQIIEPEEERQLLDSLPRATAIVDDVSQRVRDQYEINPYPRWAVLTGATPRVDLGEWLQAKFPGAAMSPLPSGRTLEILVAGCGTGQHALETVRSLADVTVLAIDLSLTSLAYAARMTKRLGVEAIDYAQADLLQSAELGRSFDMIGVGGVLHHLADPWAGWRALLGLLRPGGVMNVLLYTVRGRGDVRQGREWIATRGYDATPEGIRNCRHELLALQDDWARSLSASPDFFSVSGCRDLLFHVQEAPVTLPEVADFLTASGIDLLGVEVSPATGRAFELWSRDAGGASTRDLLRWDLFEAEHPKCFAGMLNLWIQKPAAPVG